MFLTQLKFQKRVLVSGQPSAGHSGPRLLPRINVSLEARDGDTGGQAQEGVWARPGGALVFLLPLPRLELSRVPATTYKGDWEISPAACPGGRGKLCGDFWQYLPHEVINHQILFHACGRAISILRSGMSV